jgi:hypothetical protein
MSQEGYWTEFVSVIQVDLEKKSDTYERNIYDSADKNHRNKGTIAKHSEQFLCCCCTHTVVFVGDVFRIGLHGEAVYQHYSPLLQQDVTLCSSFTK